MSTSDDDDDDDDDDDNRTNSVVKLTHTTSWGCYVGRQNGVEATQLEGVGLHWLRVEWIWWWTFRFCKSRDLL